MEVVLEFKFEDYAPMLTMVRDTFASMDAISQGTQRRPLSS
jgi:hypothetical protein